MTDAMVSLRTLVEKTPDADLLREMTCLRRSGAASASHRQVSFAAERLMQIAVGALTGAGYGEKSGDRQAEL
jgi:putative transposase